MSIHSEVFVLFLVFYLFLGFCLYFFLLEDTLCPLPQVTIIPRNLCLFCAFNNISFASVPLTFDARAGGQRSKVRLCPKSKLQFLL